MDARINKGTDFSFAAAQGKEEREWQKRMRKYRAAMINEIFFGEEVGRLTRECNVLSRENAELKEKVERQDVVSKEVSDQKIADLEAAHKKAIESLQA